MRHLYLITAAIASALAGALAAKSHTRWTTICANVPCGYLQFRLAVIDQMIAARSRAPAYLVIGDSLTEIGRWPTMCGHDPVSAGISGARSDTWLPHAKAIADTLKPEFVVLALGTNDVLTQGRLGPYEQLASSLSAYWLIAVPVHEMPTAPQEAVREANRRITKAAAHTAETIVAVTTDGVHLTAEDYGRWFGAIEKTVCGIR
jgi:lysophospholipase L1-like esterase